LQGQVTQEEGETHMHEQTKLKVISTWTSSVGFSWSSEVTGAKSLHVLTPFLTPAMENTHTISSLVQPPN